MATTTNSNSNHSSTQFSQLPTALTARILQRLPREPCLTSASLVCRAWKDAAAQATVHIECSLSSATVAGFEAWLRQPGQQVHRLKVTGRDEDNLTIFLLPWNRLSRLQSLSLTSISLSVSTFSSSSNSQGSTPATAPAGSVEGAGSNVPLLPHLSALQLSSCRLEAADVVVQLASNSPQLTSLVVERGAVGGRKTLHDALKQLPGLVVLRLPNKPLTPAAALCLAAMHSLRELQLSGWDEEAAQLPSSLTRLDIAGGKLPSQLQASTQLLHLHLERCGFPVAALACMPQLRHLHLQYTGICRDEGSSQQWSALTASTQLTYLFVMEEPQPLPKGAAQHMFPAGRLLPNLQTLMLLREDEQGDWCLTGADLASIVAACPGLKELDIALTVQEGEDVSALQRLPASCTRLHIGGNAFDDDAAAVVKQLTQLRSLKWQQSLHLTDEGLGQLVELTGLTSLDFSTCYEISDGVWEVAGAWDGSDALNDYFFTLEDSDTEGPVWQQLESICDHSPVCAAAARSKLRAENESLRQQVAATEDLLQQQLAASQAQVQRLQQQLAAAGGLGADGGGGLE